MGVEEELKRQAEKMLSEIKSARKGIKILDGRGDELLRNADAYISDTSHFLEKKDFIRAFEAVVYAWGILETLEHAGIIKIN